jgi:arsenite methyltransferase
MPKEATINLDKTIAQSDEWSDWLLHSRHADNPDLEQVVRSAIERYADRVLDGARLAPGMTVADIGTGDGLVALRAIDRVGASLRVLLVDISEPMLRHAEALAAQRNVLPQCTFLKCGAESLDGIADASIDIVTTRAALAYVTDKSKALREFHRVLKPGGRLSIAEPVFRDDAFSVRALKHVVDTTSIETLDPILPLLHRWKSAQFPDTQEDIANNPITNYSERDLLRFVQNSGFTGIHMEFHVDILPTLITSWEVFLRNSPHPWAPTHETILTERFTIEERKLFESILRPTIESGQSVSVDRVAYITAMKPLA